MNIKVFPFFLLNGSHCNEALKHYTKKEYEYSCQIIPLLKAFISVSRTQHNWALHVLSKWPGHWVITCQEPFFVSDNLLVSLSGKVAGQKQTHSCNFCSLYLWAISPSGKHCLAFAFYFSLRFTHIQTAHSRGPKKMLHVFKDSLEQERE